MNTPTIIALAILAAPLGIALAYVLTNGFS